MNEPITPPPPAGLFREAAGALELPRLLFGLPRLLRAPRGEGRSVIVFPGFGAGDGSTMTLRSYLGVQGHRASGWRLGTNRGDVAELLPRVVARVERVARSAGRPVALVGWSLGGVLARETARDRPDLVSRVITLGSPVIGGPKYTAVAGFYRRQGIDLDAIETEVAARDATPIRTPITAIYSRSDGVVSWRACIDERNPFVEHVEVTTSHLGLGFSPEVYAIVAARLGAD